MAAVLCLMLGIGATTGIFTVVNAVLLRPLPYSHPEQLVRVYTEFPTFPNGGLPRFWTSAPEFFDLRQGYEFLGNAGRLGDGGTNLGGKTQPVRVTGVRQRALLETLGVSPIMGRLIATPTMMPGRRWWRTFRTARGNRFSAATRHHRARNTAGRKKSDDHRRDATSFQFPPGESDPARVWTPLQFDPANPGGRGSHNYYLLGR